MSIIEKDRIELAVRERTDLTPTTAPKNKNKESFFFTFFSISVFSVH